LLVDYLYCARYRAINVLSPCFFLLLVGVKYGFVSVAHDPDGLEETLHLGRGEVLDRVSAYSREPPEDKSSAIAMNRSELEIIANRDGA